MRSPADLVEGRIYEIINQKIHFRTCGHLGWFLSSVELREENTIFLFIEMDSVYARFSVGGEIIKIPKGFARHLRPVIFR